MVQGTGGFRKIRMKLAGRGKAQALRVVYFHLKDRAVIFLFLLYTKSGQSDLTAEQAIDRHAYPFPQLLPTSFLLNLTHTTLRNAVGPGDSGPRQEEGWSITASENRTRPRIARLTHKLF